MTGQQLAFIVSKLSILSSGNPVCTKCGIWLACEECNNAFDKLDRELDEKAATRRQNKPPSRRRLINNIRRGQ